MRSFDLDKIKLSIPTFSSEKLCEMIACSRYFSLNQQISIACMEQLALRRQQGDVLDFEQLIEKNIQSLPPLSNNGTVLKQILSFKP